MKAWKCIGILLFWLLFFNARAYSQRYFKVLEKPEKSYSKRITRFPNGDILIGDSPLVPLSPDKNISVFLMRLDPCGDTLWATKYELGKYYLELKDVKISDAGIIFIYGSAYGNSQELIFVAKLNEKGEVLRFRLYNPITVDHSAFSIDLKQDRIMLYGLLLHRSVPKRGFVAVLNEDLALQWVRSFTPFESAGKGIITRDNGFLCRSGPYLVKLDENGERQWATILQTDPGVYPLSGPVEAADGYVLEASGHDFGFFYKVDLNGQLVWKSPKFPATKQAPDIAAPQPDGSFWAAWTCPGDAGTGVPCLLQLAPNGDILQQYKLTLDQTVDTGPVQLSAGDDRAVQLAGSANPYITKPDKVTDFLLQFSLDSLTGDCFQWEPLPAPEPNTVSLKFIPLDTAIVPATMNDVTAGALLFHPLDFQFPDLCAPAPAENLTRIDTVLPCDQPWLVYLPGPGFRWEDQNSDNPRLLHQAGSYRASNQRCSGPVTVEYQLQKQACACPVYLPNAFSPDHDGRNDRLEFFSSCPLQRLQLIVYDRWGDKVFENRTPDDFWDGAVEGKPALPGVYFAVIRYQLLDDAGQLQEGILRQDVTLWR